MHGGSPPMLFTQALQTVRVEDIEAYLLFDTEQA